MTHKMKLSILTLFGFLFFMVSACNNDKEMKEDKTQEHLQELKAELKDVGKEIDQLAENESSEFKGNAQNVMNDFNQKLNSFEQKLEESGEEIDQKTEDSLNDLKDQADKLDAKLKKMEDNTSENMEELKEEIQHDFSEFGESIKNFFEDNA